MPDSKPLAGKKPKTENLRILFWDIDGTLLSSTTSGEYRKYFAPVMREIFGSAGKLDELQVSGMTDTQIFYESLRDEGFTPERIRDEIDKLLPVFKKRMSEFVAATENPYVIKPGVREILNSTASDARFVNALLSGNLSVAAQIKLEHFDLWKYFDGKPNLFGEISHERSELGRNAVEIFGRYLNADLKTEQFVVIGDTPNDVVAARAFGARMVSVATGKNHPVEELAKHKPDIVLKDLSDTTEVLRVLATV